MLTLVAKVVVEDAAVMNVDLENVNDVKASDWYASYIGQMMAIGVLEADSDGQIHPNDLPERQEIVKILMDTLNIMEIEGVESTPALLSGFYDASSIKPENFNAMQDAVALGLIKGMGDGMLGPSDKVTRGQIAVMLKHFHDFKYSTNTNCHIKQNVPVINHLHLLDLVPSHTKFHKLVNQFLILFLDFLIINLSINHCL